MSKTANILISVGCLFIFCIIGLVIPLDGFVHKEKAEPQTKAETPVSSPVEHKPVLSGKPGIANNPAPAKDKNGNYSLSVEASAPSGDPLMYLLENGSAKYTSETGAFTGVAPTSDGKYTLTVVNTMTGEEESRQIAGFNMRQRVTRDQLQQWLNADNPPQALYAGVSAGLRITVKKAGGSMETMSDVGALVNDRTATGVSYRLLGEPGYDGSNLIESFQVEEIQGN